MAVVLDGLTLDYVLHWSDNRTVRIANEEFVNQSTPTLNENIWSEDSKIITIVCREDDDDKWTIETSANARDTVLLTDGIDAYLVWILKIESEYEGEFNFTDPWRMTITLIEI